MSVRKICCACLISMLFLSTTVMSAGTEVKSQNGGWHVSVLDPDAGQLSSIAVDSQGNPHIGYTNTLNGATYASFNGTDWNFETMTGCPGGVISLALDSKDNPHVGITAPNSNSSTNSYYGNKTGGTWKFTCVDSDDGSYGGSVAVDKNGKVQIVYNSQNGVMYAKLVNGKFEKQLVDTSDSTWHSELDTNRAIAVDSKGYPHIGYFKWSSSSHQIKYAGWNGTKWNISTIQTTIAGGYVAVTVDNNDNKDLSYGRTPHLHYAILNGSVWSDETVASDGIEQYTCIAMENGKIPHISYVDVSDANHVKVKHTYWNGTEWSFDLVDTASSVSDQIDSTSIAVDKFGYSHIVYCRHSTGLCYATNKPAVSEFTIILIPALVIIALFIAAVKYKRIK